MNLSEEILRQHLGEFGAGARVRRIAHLIVMHGAPEALLPLDGDGRATQSGGLTLNGERLARLHSRLHGLPGTPHTHRLPDRERRRHVDHARQHQSVMASSTSSLLDHLARDHDVHPYAGLPMADLRGLHERAHREPR